MEGVEVQCQMNDPAEHYYGDACYVGHSGNIICTVDIDKLELLYNLESIVNRIHHSFILQFIQILKKIIGGEDASWILIK